MRIIKYCKEYIYDLGKAPTPEAHASTVLRLKNGDLLAAWFGGTKEGEPDVRIWVSRRRRNVWKKPVQIQDDIPYTHWNPVLFETKSGEILLFYKSGSDKIATWKTYLVTSNDGGETFSPQRELVLGDVGGRGPVKNKPIYLSDGTLIAPASIELEAETNWYPIVDLSYDDGKTWELVKIPLPNKPDLAVIQPTLWESEQGVVHAMMRTKHEQVWRSDSMDYGKTWCMAYPTDIPNNNSGLDVARLSDGTLALVSNPVTKRRHPLTLAFSKDNGKSFQKVLTLEDDVGEFSYPAIIATQDKLYITYTYNRKGIAFFEICLADE